MCVYLRAKFEFSSIILTCFKQGGNSPPPPQNETLKNPPRLGLNLGASQIDSIFSAKAEKSVSMIFLNNQDKIYYH